MQYIENLPLNAEPEIFGMRDNANITCAITAADDTFGIILTLQPRVAGGTGVSREDQIIDMAKNMHAQLRVPFDVEQVGMQYPTDNLESMNTVLVQEAVDRRSLPLAQAFRALVQRSPFAFAVYD
jgi:dynein heavy chain